MHIRGPNEIYPEQAALVAYRYFELPRQRLGGQYYPEDAWDVWLDYKYDILSKATNLFPSLRQSDACVCGHYANLENSYAWLGISHSDYSHPQDADTLVTVWIVLNDEQPLSFDWAKTIEKSFIGTFNELKPSEIEAPNEYRTIH